MKKTDRLAKQVAIAAGERKYFTGLPCKHGHISLRMITGHCIECKRAFSRRPDVAAKNRASAKRWAKANPEKACRNVHAYHDRYPGRHEARVKRYQLANPHVSLAATNRRRANKLNATPPWVDLDEVKEFYKKRPAGFHVDHIVPLCNKRVCGLHVIANLQYLSASENFRKNNKLIEGQS